MSETEELKKALDTAIGRIASLESELRTKPKEVAPTKTGVDPEQFRRSLALDPIGTMRKMQVPDDQIAHVRTVLIADLLGDNAPEEMKIAARSGPQIIAAQATSKAVEDLSRRIDELTNSGQQAAKRESFKAITADKSKYPNFAKVVSTKEEALRAELDAFKGSAEEFVTAKEKEYADLASVFSPVTPAASVNADNKDQSKQVAPAPLAGGLNTVVQPAVTQEKPGVWNAEAARKLRDEIVQKVASQNK